MENFFLFFIVFPIILCLIILIPILMVRSIRENKAFDIHEISPDEDWVLKSFDSAAHIITEYQYNLTGKCIRTQQGYYRAAFQKDAEKNYDELYMVCCDENGFSDDFMLFCSAFYPDPIRKDLRDILIKYLDVRHEELARDFDKFLSETDSITPREFFQIKGQQSGDVVGVYIIHNESKDMYYIGQAKRLFFRINQHFTGHGNGDVYADYKYGDDFAIKIVPLANSGYQDIDLLEKDMIQKYDAYHRGYNRTRGNR